MNTTAIPRLMLAAMGSTGGKTTLTCALLGALRKQNKEVVAFKCGPDYIDPLFHSKVTGVPCRNLDLFLMGEQGCKTSFGTNTQGKEFALVEGVMGYYDGIADTCEASSFHLAQLLCCPVVLVVSCKGMALSVAAAVQGFVNFRPQSRIQGVILNGIKQGLYPYYKKIIEENTALKVYGFLPHLPECTLESRHLGLITPMEMQEIQQKNELLASTALQTLDMKGLQKLAQTASRLDFVPPLPAAPKKVKLAVARDNAFCFLYEDNLDMLRRMGAELCFFSPLAGESLPQGTAGVLLCGGYPELYAKTLCQNNALWQALRQGAAKGLPIWAECGGFMTLCTSVEDTAGNAYPMAGLLDAHCTMQKSLGPFGYFTLTAQEDNLLCQKGDSLTAHEFHYSTSSNDGTGFWAQKPKGARGHPCIHTSAVLFAGYPHLHLMGNPAAAQRFLAQCLVYATKINPLDNTKEVEKGWIYKR